MKNHTSHVSVVIAFYNEKKFLKESIQSVLNQTFKDWELVLVDDGSTYDSTQIAKGFSENHLGRIHYVEHVNHTNKGLSASRNKGIQHANGKLIAFLDADDVFEPEYLENQVELHSSTGATMICEATQYWYSWSDHQKEDEIIPIGAPQNQLYQPQELNLLLYPLNGYNAAPCMCGIIVLRDALIQHGGFEESFTGMYEDQVFLAKIYYNEPVYISSVCNNRYRQRSGSLMSTAQKKEDYIKIRLRFLEWFKTYLKNQKNYNNEIYSLVQKNLFPLKHPRCYDFFYGLPKRFINKTQRVLNI